MHLVELPGDDRAYYGVPKELKAFVGVGGRAWVLVGEGAVDEGQLEEASVAEGDTEGALQALNRHGEDDTGFAKPSGAVTKNFVPSTHRTRHECRPPPGRLTTD